MMSKKMVKQMNAQVQWELYSGYIYLSMAAYFADLGLPGFAAWMTSQAWEEQTHALRFYNYIIERGAKVELLAIDKPQAAWDSPLAVFQHALEHEQGVTKRINDLMNVAVAEKDHATQIFLQWFISEQVEEEDSVAEVVGKLKLIGKDGSGLFMLDKELAVRPFAPWPPVKA